MLSERLRPGCECAPWVIDEVKALEAEVKTLTSCIKDIWYGSPIDSLNRDNNGLSDYPDISYIRARVSQTILPLRL